jgi:CHAD domain-containing protein
MSANKSISQPSPDAIVSHPDHLSTVSPLADWLDQTVGLVEDAARGLRPDPVHDLRVTLRRCRSAAIGYEQLDPSPAWQRLRKEAKRLLRELGELRDVQVMRKWISKLGMTDSDSGTKLLGILADREAKAMRRARKKLKAFDTKRWRKWSRELPDRVRRIPANSPAFELLVLQQLEEANNLHRLEKKLRSKVAIHRLRIGLKRFRDSVECFLPARHASWGRELKKLQDFLGQIHDLDVLWVAIVRLRPAIQESEREAWSAAIENVRKPNLARFRERMGKADSRWEKWRAGLPSGALLERCRMDWLAVWASFLDPDPLHSRQVARLAVQLFDGAHIARGSARLPRNARDLVEAAAIVRDVGRAEGDRHHQKTSFRLIRRQNPPPGWSALHMSRIACIARLHRGGLPTHAGWEGWRGIPEADWSGLKLLGGVLRLAATLAARVEPRINSIEAGQRGEVLVIRAAGYRAEEPLASRLAEARHLLESALHQPIVIEPAN